MSFVELIDERLKILHDANLIDKEIMDFCYLVFKHFSDMNINFNNEAFELFITHLSMALMRVKAGIEEDIELNSFKADEIDDLAITEEIANMAKENIGITISDSEKYLIKIHVCNLIQNK